MRGQLGVVSGTGIDTVVARRLQMGDPDGQMRAAFDAFPVPAIAQRVWERHYVAGGKAANAWGLHDMLGNAWEWVADGYQADAYTRHALFNPLHVVSDGRRVIRGGSIRTSGWMLRCERRGWLPASDRMDTVGLRLAT